QLGLSKDAAILAQRAVVEFSQLGMPFEEGRAAANYGVALMQLRRFGEALDSFRNAQKIFEEAGNAYWIGLLNLYRAEVHVALQRLWEAQALATEARAIFDKTAIPSKQIFSLVMLGRIGLALNDLIAAESAVKQIGELV